MKRLLFMVVLTVLLVNALVFTRGIQLAKAGTITVPDDYPTIQEAINAASEGDTVYVLGGQVYHENVVANKTILLIGENREDTVIDGGNVDHTVLVTADNVTVSGFTITDSGSTYPQSGIFLDNVENSIVTDNDVSGNNGHGVFVMWGSNNSVVDNLVTYNTQTGVRIDGTTANALVAGNTIEQNEQDGIFLYYAYNVVIENNTIADNVKSGISPQGASLNVTIRRNEIANNGNYGEANTWYHGIFVYFSNGTRITENNITSNKGVGLYLNLANATTVTGNTFTSDGMIARESYGNTVQGNTVNGKPLVYLERASTYTVSNAGQVVLVNCSKIQVKNLNLSNTDAGVELFLTDDCVIADNTMANGYVGVRAYNSSRNLFSGNNITLNSYHGIYTSFSCNSNTISRNSITMNDWFGIQWGSSCSNNTISGNNVTMNNRNGVNIHTFSSNNTISGNNISGNTDTGLSVGTSSDNNIISGNNISENGLDGITLYDSSYTIVLGNNLTENECGIALFYANYSSIFHNNFIDNVNQAFTESNAYNNMWDNGYPSGGNYWSDYAGVDLYKGPYQNVIGSDGIGDTPYVIDANNQDNYPLMKPWAAITNVAILVIRRPNNLTNYRTYNVTTDSWTSWNALPKATCDSPAAAICNNELHMVIRSLDGSKLYHGYVNLATNAFSGWKLLSGSTPSAPTLTSNGTVLCLVIRGTDNRTRYRVYSFTPSRSWGSWKTFARTTCDGAAAAMIGNNLHIITRSLDGKTLWHIIIKPTAGIVRNWIRVPGATPSKPALTANQTANKLYLVIRGTNNRTNWRSYDGAADSWAGWNTVPTGTTCDGPAATALDNKLRIVIRSMTGTTLRHGYINLATNTFSGWTTLSGSTTSTPTLTS